MQFKDEAKKVSPVCLCACEFKGSSLQRESRCPGDALRTPPSEPLTSVSVNKQFYRKSREVSQKNKILKQEPETMMKENSEN